MGDSVLRLILVVFAAVTLAACSDASGPDVAQIAGSYSYTFGVSSSSAGLSCQGVGDIALQQTGAQFSGVTNGAVLCTGPAGQLTDQGSSPITGGQINGSQVSFEFALFEAGCDASGTASGSPVNRLSGSASCALVVSGQTVLLSGTWQASR